MVDQITMKFTLYSLARALMRNIAQNYLMKYLTRQTLMHRGVQTLIRFLKIMSRLKTNLSKKSKSLSRPFLSTISDCHRHKKSLPVQNRCLENMLKVFLQEIIKHKRFALRLFKMRFSSLQIKWKNSHLTKSKILNLYNYSKPSSIR